MISGEFSFDLDEILDEFMPKIGTCGEEDYNEELDDICSKLLNIKQELNWL